MRWLSGFAMLIASFAAGCAIPGDPSCAVSDEINDQCCLKRALYHPEFDPVGLRKTTWYSCPNAWSPECPGVECGYCENHISSAATHNAIERTSMEQLPSPDEFQPPVRRVTE